MQTLWISALNSACAYTAVDMFNKVFFLAPKVTSYFVFRIFLVNYGFYRNASLCSFYVLPTRNLAVHSLCGRFGTPCIHGSLWTVINLGPRDPLMRKNVGLSKKNLSPLNFKKITLFSTVNWELFLKWDCCWVIQGIRFWIVGHVLYFSLCPKQKNFKHIHVQ